jgi:Arc/MetJ-type ribon-helix-helix transcriptional regulator
MGTRSVRLDDETERAVELLVEQTGASLSTILKRGILALRDKELGQTAASPWQLYQQLDLGEGGYAVAPARDSRKALRDAIRKRHRRG